MWTPIRGSGCEALAETVWLHPFPLIRSVPRDAARSRGRRRRRKGRNRGIRCGLLSGALVARHWRKRSGCILSPLSDLFLATLPAVVDVGDGAKVAIAESDVDSYPGLWLRGTGGNGLAASFPPYPLKESLTGDRDYRVVESADYIAVTAGTRTIPWRVIGIADRDGDLLTNQIVYLLEKPSLVQDTSWIKPGKVAWDWWNANNVYGVDFKAGINTETYKYYIDFAAKYGLPYIILDEGWYKLGNLLEVVPEINMDQLAAYAKQKKVGIILWVVWKTL